MCGWSAGVDSKIVDLGFRTLLEMQKLLCGCCWGLGLVEEVAGTKARGWWEVAWMASVRWSRLDGRPFCGSTRTRSLICR